MRPVKVLGSVFLYGALLASAAAQTVQVQAAEVTGGGLPGQKVYFPVTTAAFTPQKVVESLASFAFTIPGVTNPGIKTISGQVYLGTQAITGCTVTVKPGANQTLTGTCTVSAANNAALFAAGVVNFCNTPQGLFLGLGSEAVGLVFAGGGTQVTLTLTPALLAPLVFTLPNGGTPSPNPIQLNTNGPCSASFSAYASSETGGNFWLGVGTAAYNGTAQVQVQINSTFAPATPGEYPGTVTVVSPEGSVGIPVLLAVLPATPQYVQQGSKIAGVKNPTSPRLGQSVSISYDGDTALVGAPSDANNVGSAREYQRTSGIWTPVNLYGQGSPPSLSLGGNSQLGAATALSWDGSVLLVGAPFDTFPQGAAWAIGGPCAGTGPQKLVPDTLSNGFSVSLSADGLTALVGAPWLGGPPGLPGAAWVFTCSQGQWQPGVELVGGGSPDPEGLAVALSADGLTAIVGGSENAHFAAWVFTYSPQQGWTQQAELPGAGGSGNTGACLGASLSADGNTAALQSNGGDEIQVYTRSSSTWSPPTMLPGSNAAHLPAVSLSADGKTLAIADGHTVALYQYANSSWTQTQSTTPIVPFDAAGTWAPQALQLSGDGGTLIVGDPVDNGVGAAWMFVSSGPVPSLTSISPTENLAGSAFTLTVNGANFLPGAQVQVSGVKVPTTFVNAGQLTAAVPASAAAVTGAVPVTAANPDAAPAGSASLQLLPPFPNLSASEFGAIVTGRDVVYSATYSNPTQSLSTDPILPVVVSVTPIGATLVAISGQGWTCQVNQSRCYRSDIIGPGESYPPVVVTLNISGPANSLLLPGISATGGGFADQIAAQGVLIAQAPPCDLNADGMVNMADLQLMVNEALGIEPALNHLAVSITGTQDVPGSVTASDVQQMIDALLGPTTVCAVG